MKPDHALTPAGLLYVLQKNGLLPPRTDLSAGEPAGDAECGAAPAHDRPWYVAALLGVSGWFAGIFLLVLVALLFKPDSAGAAGALGMALLVAAWVLFKADQDGVFLSQFAFSLSIAAQCLLLFAIASHFHSAAPLVATTLALQLVLVLLIPNRLHATISALFATIVWALTIRFTFFDDLDLARGFRDYATSPSDALLGWLIAWLPIAVGLRALISKEARWMARGWQAVIRPAMNGAVLGLAFGTLASRPFESLTRWGHVQATQDWLALWPLLSALGALGGLAAAFALRSPALMGACIFAGLLHLSQFYYELGTSLLLKSVLMASIGVAMLLAARAVAHEGDRA